MPSDQMHDMLISMCTQEQRLEEAVDLVKRLARRPPSVSSPAGSAAAGAAAGASPPSSPRAGGGRGAGGVPGAATASGLQEQTLNSLIRALCGKYVNRALRLLSLCQVRRRQGLARLVVSSYCTAQNWAIGHSHGRFLGSVLIRPCLPNGFCLFGLTPPQTMGMRTSRRTYLALIAGCARASRSAAAYDLYRTRECLLGGVRGLLVLQRPVWSAGRWACGFGHAAWALLSLHCGRVHAGCS